MKEALLKLAKFIAKHYMASAMYNSRCTGECLCKYCKNANCKIKSLQDDLEDTYEASI